MSFKTYFLVGGAGFLGSHFIDALLKQKETQKVTIYDNFTSGKEWHYRQHNNNPKFCVIKNDIKDTDKLIHAMQGHDIVMHFASNPDIARAAIEPSIDFTEGIYLTYQVLEAARKTNIKRVIYISGSGVYGDVGEFECCETSLPMLPVSTYGASKLAGEAFLSSYCHMFDLSALIFRCGNIVGPRQTHGVGYDFVKKLLQNQTTLTILGNGTQSKSYIHVDDVVSAVLLANSMLNNKYDIYNLATNDYITVLNIAEIITENMGIKNINYNFTGGDRGWKGDVPIVRLNTTKIRSLGWKCERNSHQAIKDSSHAIMQHIQQGLVTL